MKGSPESGVPLRRAANPENATGGPWAVRIQSPHPMTDSKLSRYFFIALLLGTAVVFFRMLQIFFVPVLLAAGFAALFPPMCLLPLRAFRGPNTLPAFSCCLALLLLLVVPLYLVADLVTHEAI